VALSETAAITLSSYKETSLQGDSALVKSTKNGVETHFEGNEMTLVKTHDFKFEDVDFELNNTTRYCTNHCCHLSWLKNCCHLK
jgi:3-phosphoshikimate 1-carboxyvinyltransferase